MTRLMLVLLVALATIPPSVSAKLLPRSQCVTPCKAFLAGLDRTVESECIHVKVRHGQPHGHLRFRCHLPVLIHKCRKSQNVCVGIPTTTTTLPPGGCALRPEDPTLPNEVDLLTPTATDPTGNGSDLDNGWTGTSHNFPIIGGSVVKYCLSGCDRTTQPLCTASGTTAVNGTPALNGVTFGAPLPLLTVGTPVCVVNRFRDPLLTGTFNVQTGEAGIGAQPNLIRLFSDVYLRTTFSEVCPRCTIPGGGGDIGSTGSCSSTAKNAGAPCTVDGEVVVAGKGLYLLSSACTPLGDAAPTTLNIDLPLTTGTAPAITGSVPCPDPSGPQTQDDNCGSATCNAGCTGAACVAVNPDGNCVDAKGGISQLCCSNNTSLPCFPTKNGGSITRTGKPVVPGGPAGLFAGTFCIAHTDSGLINQVTGLPGPGALLLPAKATVLP